MSPHDPQPPVCTRCKRGPGWHRISGLAGGVVCFDNTRSPESMPYAAVRDQYDRLDSLRVQVPPAPKLGRQLSLFDAQTTVDVLANALRVHT